MAKYNLCEECEKFVKDKHFIKYFDMCAECAAEHVDSLDVSLTNMSKELKKRALKQKLHRFGCLVVKTAKSILDGGSSIWK